MFFILLLLWFVFNGRITLELFFIGVVLAAVLTWFSVKFLDYDIKANIKRLKKIGKLLAYGAVLFGEIIKANIQVIAVIVNTKKEIHPKRITFTTSLHSIKKRAWLGNAITLTPGTITESVNQDKVTVICLDEAFAAGIDETVFEQRLQQMEEVKSDGTTGL